MVAASAGSETVTTAEDIDRTVRPSYDAPIDDAAVEAVIAKCGGDAREAVRELLRINQALRSVVSRGYVRSRGMRDGPWQDY
jgi:hypothetical protein